MMKHEFEELAQVTVTDTQYSKIERVYMGFDKLFPNKEAFVKMFKAGGMKLISSFLEELDSIEARQNTLTYQRGCPHIAHIVARSEYSTMYDVKCKSCDYVFASGLSAEKAIECLATVTSIPYAKVEPGSMEEQIIKLGGHSHEKQN